MKQGFKKILILSAVICFGFNTLYADQQKWPDSLTFGVIPVAGATSMKETFGGLAQHLEKKLGMKVKLQTAGDYAAVISAMGHKHADIAYLGPKSYVEAAKRADAEAVAVEIGEESKMAGYYGLIISKKGSGIKTIEDMKNIRWAFTSSHSTSGTLLPAVLFSQKGIKPKDYFSKILYSGGHEASILSVKAGKIDAASTNTLDFARGEGKHWSKDDFNIIHKSELIPGSLIAVRGDLPTSLKNAVQNAVIAYDDKDGLKKMKLLRFQKVDDSAYDPIRELIKLKKALKAKK